MIASSVQAPLATRAEWRDWFAAWAVQTAAPLWAEHGCDRAGGGFFDRLDPGTLRNAADFKRLRVTARQIFVFATAARMGFAAGDALVTHGLEHLLGPCRIASGGYRSRLTLDNRAIDGPIDLYDNAFALFALAHGHARKPDAALLEAALEQCEYLTRAFFHPAGGYLESLPPVLPRRQNPHMHLLEALLAWLEILGPVEPFRDLANTVLDLAQRRLFAADHDLLVEFFEDDWQIRDLMAEPGHHFEWVWLLAESRRLGLAVPDFAPRLYRLALDHGRDPATQFLYGAFGPGGAPIQTTVRLWPHTEWLRAETVVDDGNIEAAATAVARFLDHPVPGLWYETFVPEQGFRPEAVPASSLYHLFGAMDAVVAARADQG